MVLGLDMQVFLDGSEQGIAWGTQAECVGAPEEL